MRNDEIQKLIDHQEQMSKLMKSISAPFANNPALKVMERLQKMTEPKWKYESLLPEPIAKDLLVQADLLKQLEPSPQLKEIMRQIEPLTRQFAEIHESEAIKSIRLASESVLASFERSGIQEILRIASNTFSEVDFKLIKEMENSPFGLSGSEILAQAEEFEVLPEFRDGELVNAAAIKSELTTTKDFKNLAPKTKSIIHLMLFTIFLNLLSNYIYDQAKILMARDIEEISPPNPTPEKARKFSRNPGKNIRADSLQDVRIVIGSGLNLRESPSISAKVILELPVGKLLDVLDRSNRTWLYVGVTIDGEYLEGWVSRRYTTTFK